MKISLDWIQQYVDLPENREELIDVLPMLGLEVEEEENDSNPSLKKVVVGEVLSKKPHPEADRLSVCSVDVGSGQHSIIVCGATNFKSGDRVPVALPGATLPGGFKIKKSKLRGVESEGMMCSAKELELGSDDQGLLLLQDSPEIGIPINQVFTTDKTLELEITANRGDCLSHLGVAREIGARYQKSLRVPIVRSDGSPAKKIPSEWILKDLRIESDACPYYTLWCIKGVKIGPSPDWMKERLESIGLRSINNVVDITNFILHETGQPLHAFDAEKIHGSSLVVRQAYEHESITTLDQIERKLDPSILVIADSEKPLVVAGVMGSVDAEVDDKTTDLVLESAWFLPASVRSTSRKLGLHTDSSQRFARNVDPRGIEYAAKRSIDLIIELAGGTLDPSFISYGSSPRGDRSIEIGESYVEQICGFPIHSENLTESWKRLGFEVTGNGPWQVMVPSFRSEVERPIDLVEEFLRIQGTEDLKHSSFAFPATNRENDPTYDFCDRAIDNLVGQGFQESCNYSLRSAEEISRWYPKIQLQNLSLNNPLTADHTHVRPSLLPGLVDNLAHNQKNLNSLSRVFESGRVFRSGPHGNIELISLAFAAFPSSNVRDWKTKESLDFFELKNHLQRLLHATGLNEPSGIWETLSGHTPWQDGYSSKLGDVNRNKLELTLGILDLSLTKEKEAKGPIYAAEVFIDPILLSKKKKIRHFESFSSFPPAIKDIALVVDQSESAESVRLKVEKIAKSIGQGKFEVDPVTIFDLFSGKGMNDDQKSIACSMRFRAPDRTLSEKELNQAFESVVEKIGKETPYELRK